MKNVWHIVCGTVFLVCAPGAFGQVGQRWEAAYDGAGKQTAYAIVVDDEGCVYVTGNSRVGSTCDIVTVKYDACGAEVWSQPQVWAGADYETYESDEGDQSPSGIALDAQGVYVRGGVRSGTDWDYGVMKYDRDTGQPLWAGPAIYDRGGDDYPVSIAVGCGGVYVTGYSWNGADWDYLTVGFDPDSGAFVNAYAYSGISNDYAWDVAVDATGVYVTGGSYRVATGMDYLTIKYNCGLTQELWSAFWDSPSVTHPFDFARAIALGCNSYVIVTGECGGDVGDGEYDYGTVAYNRTSGAEVWAKRHNGTASGNDYACDIVATSSGVFVTGRSMGSGWDYRTIKYDCSGGTERWANTYDYNGNDDEAWAIVACDDEVYVTGQSWSGSDYATVAYSTANDGNELWSLRYDGPAHASDYGHAVAAYCDGGCLRAVYVTGESSTGSAGDYATVRYSVPPPPPTLLTPMNGALDQTTCGTLDWSDVPCAGGYRVQIGTSCGSGATHDVTDSQYAYSGLQRSITYYWRVRSKCGTFGDYSNCFSFKTYPGLPAPTLESPANEATDVPVAGTLNWSDVSGATGYRFQIGTTCGSGLEADVTASECSYSGLLPGTTYYWRVKTKDACGTPGDYSECFSFTTADVPPIPTVSEWGLVILTLLLLTAGTMILGQRRRRAVHA